VEPASPVPAPLDQPAADRAAALDAGQAADAPAGRAARAAEAGSAAQAEAGSAAQASAAQAVAGSAAQAEAGSASRPAEAGEPAPAAAASRADRGQERRPRDMIMSLAVLLVPIALLLILYRTLLSGDAPITVDPAPTIQEAQAAKLFPVAVPQGLSDDWHTSTATFTRAPNGATLRLGYVDPDKDPIQLIESSVPTDTLLPTELSAGAKPTGNFRSASGVWRVYDARPGEKALVLGEQNRTIVIVGRTDVDNLEKLATSLS